MQKKFSDHFGAAVGGIAGFALLFVATYAIVGTFELLDRYIDRDINYDGAFTYSDAITACSINFNGPGRWLGALAGAEFWSFFEIDQYWQPIWITLPLSLVVYLVICISGTIGAALVYAGTRVAIATTAQAAETAKYRPSWLMGGDVVVLAVVGGPLLLLLFAMLAR